MDTTRASHEYSPFRASPQNSNVRVAYSPAHAGEQSVELGQQSRTSPRRGHQSPNNCKQVVNCKHLARTEILLILNKKDVFKEQLRTGKSLSHCFSAEIVIYLMLTAHEHFIVRDTRNVSAGYNQPRRSRTRAPPESPAPPRLVVCCGNGAGVSDVQIEARRASDRIVLSNLLHTFDDRICA